jgi:hypothetical protein
MVLSKVDARVPSLSAMPPCSLPDVLKQSGQRAQELVDHLQNFIAHEQVRLSRMLPRLRWLIAGQVCHSRKEITLHEDGSGSLPGQATRPQWARDD